MENRAQAGHINRKTIDIESRVILPVKETAPKMAPKVTITDDCISERVGIFFSVIDSITNKYKITICEKGITAEGSLNSDSK